MIQRLGMSDTLQRALMGLGDIGPALQDAEKNKANIAATNAGTAETLARTPGVAALAGSQKLSFESEMKKRRLMDAMDALDKEKGQLQSADPQDPLNGAAGPLPPGQERTPGVLSDAGTARLQSIPKEHASLLATLARENGDSTATPELMAAKANSALKQAQNTGTLSDLDVAGKQTDNATGAFKLGQAQKLAPFQQTEAQNTADASQYAAPEAKAKVGLTEAEAQKARADADKAAKEAKDGKQPNKEQFDAAGFGRRIEQAIGTFDTLAKGGYDRGSVGAGLRAAGPNLTMGASAQQQDQAERNFVNAVLRRESGAAISKDEFTSAEKQYFPRTGDSDEVKAQKTQNRAQAMENMRAAAGPAWEKVAQTATATPGGALDKTDPRVKAALDAGYTEAEIHQFLGRGK